MMTHKNLVEVLDTFYNEERNEMMIVAEECEYGDFCGPIRQQQLLKSRFKEPAVLYVVGQVCEALFKMRKLGFIHGDVRAENILVKMDG